MAQNLLRIQENNFEKGYNDKDKPEDLKSGYMADIVNAFIEENKLVKRTGYTTIGDAPVSKPILGQDKFEPSGGTKYILRARNTSDDANSVVEGWSGSGNWVSLTGATSQTANAPHRFVTAQNACYIFNGTDTVLKTTNGTSTSTVAGIPVGKGGEWFHNYLFVYGVSSNPSRLYFSDVNTPETFDGSNGYVDINPGDNAPITALGVQKDELLIFTASRTWSLTGFGIDDFVLSDVGEVLTGMGTEAPSSVVEAGNDTYYLSFQGDTPHFRSAKRTQFGEVVDGGIISDAITGTMKRLIVSRIFQCAGIFDGRRVWWAVCTSGSTNNEVLVYDTLTNGWVRLTGIEASVFHTSTISGTIELYFGSSTANGKSYILDGSTSDDGDAIDFTVVTPMYDPQPGHKSRFKYLYATADIDNDVMLDVDFSIDGFNFQDLGTFSLTGEGAEFGSAIFGESKFGSTSVARDRIDWAGGNAYYMQYQFRNNEADENVTLREWEIFYQVKPLRAV